MQSCSCVARPLSAVLPPSPTRCSATAYAPPVATKVRRRAGDIGLRYGVTALLAAGLTLTLQPFSCAHAEPAPVLVGVPRVVDGDTLEVAGSRVRFFGMDAPESKQLCTTSGGEEYLCGAPSSQPFAR